MTGSRLTEKERKAASPEGPGTSLLNFQAPTNGSGRGRTGHRLASNGTHAIWGFVILEAGTESLGSFERAKDTAAFEILWSQIKSPWMSLPGWVCRRQFGVIANPAAIIALSLPPEKKPGHRTPRAMACYSPASVRRRAVQLRICVSRL